MLCIRHWVPTFALHVRDCEDFAVLVLELFYLTSSKEFVLHLAAYMTRCTSR